MGNVDDLLPTVARRALRTLASDLRASGYRPDEVKGIVAGAQERALEARASGLVETDEELLQLISGFSEIDLPPAHVTESTVSDRLSLGLALLSLALMIAAFFTPSETDIGGAIMLFAAMIVAPTSIALAWSHRRTAFGRSAGIVSAFVLFSFAAFAFMNAL